MQSLKSGGFMMPTDEHGRYAQALAPVATLNISTSGTSNGDFIPGDRDAIKRTWTIVDIASDKDVWLQFGDGAATADTSSKLFLAGTQTMKVPAGMNFVAAKTKDGSSGGTLSVTVMQ